MSKSFALAFCRITLLLLCTLPLTSQAASSKEAPLDLSILKQSDALRPYMTAQQRIVYVEGSKLIKQGQSNICSGQNLQLEKASALDAHQAIAAKKFNFDLVEQDDYIAALELAATQTLEACLDAGYNNIFFDGLRIVTAEQNVKAGPKLHNAAYDTFIKVDGTLDLAAQQLILLESHFIQRAYFPADAASEDFSSAATAELSVTPNEDNYTIVAIAYGNGRELEIGTIALQLPE
jgi:hypothetical protein